MRHLLKSLCEVHIRSELSNLDKPRAKVVNRRINIAFTRSSGVVVYSVWSEWLKPSKGILTNLQTQELNKDNTRAVVKYVCFYNCALKDLNEYRREDTVG